MEKMSAPLRLRQPIKLALCGSVFNYDIFDCCLFMGAGAIGVSDAGGHLSAVSSPLFGGGCAFGSGAAALEVDFCGESREL